MKPDNFFDDISILLNRGIKYDLLRMYKAADLIHKPHTKYKTIHVAGTNGKGSTSSYIESVLRIAGFKTGMFTSPYINSPEEQFQINGKIISEENLNSVYGDIKNIINELNLSFFEASALIAFEIFQRAGVDYAVIETGMGGRLDATNIIIPEVSVITKLAMDHSEFLGDSLLKIAGEKLGIVKASIPLIMLDPVDSQIRELAINKCKELGCEITFVDPCDNARDNSFSWNDMSFIPGMKGRHQKENALLALNALGKIGSFNYDVLYRGINSCSLPGRFQIASADCKCFVVDAAHNPDAASVLYDTLETEFPFKKILFVVGILKDKDMEGIIKVLAKKAEAIYFTKPDTDRAAEPEQLYEIGRLKFNVESFLAEDITEALSLAIENANEKEDIICVTGSFYMVKEALSFINQLY